VLIGLVTIIPAATLVDAERTTSANRPRPEAVESEPMLPRPMRPDPRTVHVEIANPRHQRLDRRPLQRAGQFP
jgi:hypothetical protein